jgi:hypothetical protein
MRWLLSGSSSRIRVYSSQCRGGGVAERLLCRFVSFPRSFVRPVVIVSCRRAVCRVPCRVVSSKSCRVVQNRVASSVSSSSSSLRSVCKSHHVVPKSARAIVVVVAVAFVVVRIVSPLHRESPSVCGRSPSRLLVTAHGGGAGGAISVMQNYLCSSRPSAARARARFRQSRDLRQARARVGGVRAGVALSRRLDGVVTLAVPFAESGCRANRRDAMYRCRAGCRRRLSPSLLPSSSCFARRR